MMSRTLGVLFGGIGGVEVGAARAGITTLWSVERSPPLSQIHQSNFNPTYMMGHPDSTSVCGAVEDMRQKVLDNYGKPKILWASPPCQQASKARRRTTHHPDWDAGKYIVDYVRDISPDWVIIENVVGYKQEGVFKGIKRWLRKRGYVDVHYVVDAAHYHTPQHRVRMYYIANRLGIHLPPQYTDDTIYHNHLPDIEAGSVCSWWSAIKDIWQDLPLRPLPPWMAWYVDDNDNIYNDNILINSVSGYSGGKRTITIRSIDRPSFACIVAHRRRPAYARVDGITRQITPRAWARLMGFPDSYHLSKSVYWSLTGLGNAVCPPMAEVIFRAIIHNDKQKKRGIRCP